MTVPILHIVFTESGSHRLRAALRQAGRPDRVIALTDDLTIGPINPLNPTLRARWIRSEIGRVIYLGAGPRASQFWASVAAHQGRRIVWTSRRSAWDYAGFLALNWRLGDAGCEVVDLTDMPFTILDRRGDPLPANEANCLMMLDAKDITDNRIWELARPVEPATRERWRSEWETLRADKAMLRIVDTDLVMRSAPISFYDEMLLSRVPVRFGKSARIVGEVMRILDDHACPHQVADYFLAARLQALASMGRIESHGDLRQIRFSEVRVPQD